MSLSVLQYYSVTNPNPSPSQITSTVNCFTSFFSGFVIFTYLGYMAKSQEKTIETVADQGPGLVFEVYPQAVATLPGSQFW